MMKHFVNHTDDYIWHASMYKHESFPPLTTVVVFGHNIYYYHGLQGAMNISYHVFMYPIWGLPLPSDCQHHRDVLYISISMDTSIAKGGVSYPSSHSCKYDGSDKLC